MSIEWDIEGIGEAEICRCGRSGCDYFAPGVDDNGSSFSRKELVEIQKALAVAAKKLTKTLAKPLPARPRLTPEQRIWAGFSTDETCRLILNGFTPPALKSPKKKSKKTK